MYHKQPAREELLKKMPDYFSQHSKVLAFVNLAIYPHKFEVVFKHIRELPRISSDTYNALKGTVTALMVMSKRQHKESSLSVDEYVLDFIQFIRSDNKGDPTKFLLSMRRYMPRYMFLKGLAVAFNVDWRRLVADALDLKELPQATNYHTMFTNRYTRNLLWVYIVWKNFKESHEEGFEQGVNDIVTLLAQANSHKSSLGEIKQQALFNALMGALPSWSYSTRRKASWAIDTCQDGTSMVNRQFTDWKYKQVAG